MTTSLLTFGLLLISTLLLTQAIDLKDFNYTEFVDNIKKTGEFRPAEQRQLYLLKEGGDMKPAGDGVVHLGENQTAFVMQGKQGLNTVKATNSSVELNSKGGF
ncbi:hypothetical protein PRIPAC_76046 [Pristionchus pacificus]|uniref:Uncharacterized protein n=1 Tax=Pristionchus pacificus TaxID=54126 RepID=A0A2A6CRF7_PRIPA|nr:hypothetical protein PRIPAC_76046 [Pristionchus pacificus]|eukprot:PDM80611.1 hypothetical protein PRIPAC_35614 [Pristionchus pacificus]